VTGIWDTNGVFSSLHWAAVTNRYSTALRGKSMTSEKWWELLETAREHTTFKNSPDPLADHGDDDDDDVDPRTITLSSGMFSFVQSTPVDASAKMSKLTVDIFIFIKLLNCLYKPYLLI